MYEWLTALFFGFIEGLTEFIPVSSTAHLVILIEGLSFDAISGHVFEVFIQLGAILAIVALYWNKIWDTFIHLPRQAKAQKFTINLIIGTLPAVIVGLIGHSYIKEHFYNPVVIASALIIGGFLILLLEKPLVRMNEHQTDDVDHITFKSALVVGLCQMLALIPGVSRSGATIMGSLGCGLSRKTAAEFSFFLAIPIMIGAVAYDTYKNWENIIAYDQMGLMLAGLFAAFITALLIIRPALRLIERYGFAPFGWYRIAAGIVILLVFM